VYLLEAGFRKTLVVVPVDKTDEKQFPRREAPIFNTILTVHPDPLEL
jgi:hypothetical protein